jgi:uncharacterized protein (DUF1778 family)
MQLDHHLAQVTAHLSAAAALGDERTREIADALAAAATPALRLALLNALSEAADEITADLLDLPGSPTVAVRLDGDEAVVEVRLADTGPDTAPGRGHEDGEPNARISLRLTEALKADVDTAAARDGVSVNTWLVRAASAALEPNPLDALAAFGKNFAGGMGGGMGGGPGGRGGSPRQRHGGGHQRITGWING